MSEARRQSAASLFTCSGGLLLGGCVVLLLWRTFTDSPSWHELLLGSLSTVLTMLFLANVLRTESLRLKLRWRDLIQMWRIPWSILARCWQITWLLLKDLAGKPTGSYYRDCGFRTSRHDPVLVGRTVLAVMYTTVAPNFIVIGIDPEQSLMLFHQIERSSVSPMTRALGAQS